MKPSSELAVGDDDWVAASILSLPSELVGVVELSAAVVSSCFPVTPSSTTTVSELPGGDVASSLSGMSFCEVESAELLLGEVVGSLTCSLPEPLGKDRLKDPPTPVLDASGSASLP